MLEFFNFYIDVNVHNIWLTLFNIYGVKKYQSLCVQESGQPVITAELVGRYQQLVRQHGAGFWWTLSLDEVSSHWPAPDWSASGHVTRVPRSWRAPAAARRSTGWRAGTSWTSGWTGTATF